MTTVTEPRAQPSYVAAWPCADSEAMLAAAGVTKRVHLTTFFDGFGQLPGLTPFPWDGPRTARIQDVVVWPVGKARYVIAELTDCGWSQAINDHYHAQGAREDLPHKAHITLSKHATDELVAALREQLVGQVIRFDRHGPEVR